IYDGTGPECGRKITQVVQTPTPALEKEDIISSAGVDNDGRCCTRSESLIPGDGAVKIEITVETRIARGKAVVPEEATALGEDDRIGIGVTREGGSGSGKVGGKFSVRDRRQAADRDDDGDPANNRR